MQTIIPALFRKVKDVNWKRERIITPDEDFIDIDWSTKPSDKLIIIFHGLESSSGRAYVRGMAKKFNDLGWSAAAMNFRGCSGEENKLYRSYHSGSSDDIKFIIDFILNDKKFRHVILIGFSLGGNALLKYLGEMSENISDRIKSAVAVSVPCDLAASATALAQRTNYIYMKRFVNKLRIKFQQKARTNPGMMDVEKINSMTTFRDVDDLYTAPAHGYLNAEDYYNKCSSIYFLQNITIPTLILNAADDPFLTDGCFPYKEAEKNKNVFLEVPASGGHVGFKMNNGEYWQEKRAAEFAIQFVS